MSKPTLNEVIAHCRNREYMSGVERDRLRVKATGEVFTPTPLVQEILDQLPPEVFTDPTKTFLDNSCGDGQFLSEVLIRKIQNGSTFEQALSTIYGVDLMPDNVELCRNRLLCGQEHLRHIVERNIVCADALRYHYRFDGTDPYSKTPGSFTEAVEFVKEQEKKSNKVKPNKKSRPANNVFDNLFEEC
ncbi:MAG: N-6 DNA methylase [Fischerella sp.]|nr:N-6 DNA methylase [Fischerella sp.]